MASLLLSCAVPRDRELFLSEKRVSEADFGGVERWVAFDKYNSVDNRKVIFQVGYFKNNNIGFVLFEGGTKGEYALFYRDGINLRWDWENFSIIIEPNGTGFYYDFKSETRIVKPSGIYNVEKF